MEQQQQRCNNSVTGEFQQPRNKSGWRPPSTKKRTTLKLYCATDFRVLRAAQPHGSDGSLFILGSGEIGTSEFTVIRCSDLVKMSCEPNIACDSSRAPSSGATTYTNGFRDCYFAEQLPGAR